MANALADIIAKPHRVQQRQVGWLPGLQKALFQRHN